MQDVQTPEEFILALQWNFDNLKINQDFLKIWDNRDSSFYKSFSKDSIDFDKRERKHLRNCVNFWEKRLNNEN